MPKDQREARIYYQSKLYEISDTYLFFNIAKVIGWGAVIQRDYEGMILISILTLSLLILATIRIMFYYFKDRYLRLFGYHLVILYGLDMVLFAIQYHIKIKYMDGEEESNTRIDRYNRTLEIVFILHTLFTTPTFRVCVIYQDVLFRFKFIFLTIWV